MTNDDKDEAGSPRTTRKGLGPSGAAMTGTGDPTLVPTGNEPDRDDSGIDDLLAEDESEKAPVTEENVVLTGSTASAPVPAEPFPVRRTGEVTRVTHPHALAAEAAEGLAQAAGDLGKMLQTSINAPVTEPSASSPTDATTQSAASTDVDAAGGAKAEVKKSDEDRERELKETSRSMMRFGLGDAPIDTKISEGVYLYDAHFLWTLLEQGEELQEETPSTDKELLDSLAMRRRWVLEELAQRKDELNETRLGSPDISDEDLKSLEIALLSGAEKRSGEQQRNADATRQLVREERERRQLVKEQVAAAGATASVGPAPAPASTSLGTAPTVPASDLNLTPGPALLAARNSPTTAQTVVEPRPSGPPPGRLSTPQVIVAYPPSAPASAPVLHPLTDPQTARSGTMHTPVPIPARVATPPRPMAAVTTRVAPVDPLNEPINERRRNTERLEIQTNRTGTVAVILVVLAVAIGIGLLLRGRSPKNPPAPAPIVAQQPTSDGNPVVVPVTAVVEPGTDTSNALPQAAPQEVAGATDCTLISTKEMARVGPEANPGWICDRVPPVVKMNADAAGNGGEEYYELCPSNCTRNTQ